MFAKNVQLSITLMQIMSALQSAINADNGILLLDNVPLAITGILLMPETVLLIHPLLDPQKSVTILIVNFLMLANALNVLTALISMPMESANLSVITATPGIT